MDKPNWKICRDAAREHMEKARTFLDADRPEFATGYVQAAATFTVGAMLCQQLELIERALTRTED